MESENLTDNVQSLPVDVVRRLPDEALVVLTTDEKADCRPRLYIHNRKASPVAYVLKFRCLDGDQIRRRSVYLGPLREIEVEHMQLLLEALRSPAYMGIYNRTLTDRERSIRAAQARLRSVVKDATEYARQCGFHIRGRRVYRIGAVGVRAERQGYMGVCDQNALDELRALKELNARLGVVLDAAYRVATEVLLLLMSLAARANDRSADAPPHSRLLRYERTLAGLYRYRDMVAEAGQRMRQHPEPHEESVAA